MCAGLPRRDTRHRESERRPLLRLRYASSTRDTGIWAANRRTKTRRTTRHFDARLAGEGALRDSARFAILLRTVGRARFDRLGGACDMLAAWELLEEGGV